jgi:peptide/nickel transport system permease protein
VGEIGRRRAPKILVALFERRLAFLAALMLATIVLSALLAPWIAPHDPGTIGKLDITNRLKPPVFMAGGSWSYPLGTDAMGNDILSRLMFAGRVSLLVGFAAVAIAGAIGLVLGLVAGYIGKWVDEALMRLADVQLSLPPLVLAIFLMAILGAGIWNVIAVLALSAWVSLARVIRGQVLSLRAKEFVEAARTTGTSDVGIMFRHILPNTVAPAIVISSFALAGAIMTESALSFLGLGVNVSTPTWGAMLADGREYIATAWWLGFFPGVVLTLTVLSINLLGDWLRDYLDPRLKL